MTGNDAERFFLTKDNSGHTYVVPVSRRKEWVGFCEIPEDDERGWDVPAWARRVEGLVTFTDPKEAIEEMLPDFGSRTEEDGA